MGFLHLSTIFYLLMLCCPTGQCVASLISAGLVFWNYTLILLFAFVDWFYIPVFKIGQVPN
jgi:hypothetical protein